MNAHSRDGATLVELMVTLTIIGILVSVTLLAFRTPSAAVPLDAVGQLFFARSVALREGRIVTIDVVTPEGVVSASAYPDGRIVADSQMGIGVLNVTPPKARQ